MKRNFFLLSMVICLLTVHLLITYFLTSTNQSYSLKLINYDSKINRYVIFPKVLTFKPLNVAQIFDKFKTTQYNFIYYLDWNYLKIIYDVVELKILV